MAMSRCTYLHINGKRCTMPATNGNELCFQHESRLMRIRLRHNPPSTFNKVPLINFVYPEDHDAILENIYAIARAYERGHIDDRMASITDRLMNTALRTLRQARKLEATVTREEMVLHFRVDNDGNPRAVDSPVELEPGSEPEVLLPAQIPAISAQAEDPAEPQPDPDQAAQISELERDISRKNISRLLSILTREGDVNSLLSNTYIFRNGKLIVAPDRSLSSGQTSAQGRATAYIFLTNMK